VLEKNLTCSSGYHSSPVALEEWRVNLLFELGQTLADCRRANVFLLSCPGDIAVVAGGHEQPQSGEIQVTHGKTFLIGNAGTTIYRFTIIRGNSKVCQTVELLETNPMTAAPPSLPRKVVIREVGLRDGLQSIATIVSTERKLEWLRDAVAAGQTEIEVGSFVPAKLMPQLADTEKVLAYAKTLPGLFASVLVPNLRGADGALDGEADLMILPLSASHAHSLANLRKTPDEVVAELGRIRAARDASGKKTLIEGGVGTAFGCTIQGQVDESEVLRLMQALLDAGADRVSLADTVGYADPASVSRLFEKALKIAGDRFCCGHFHDTRGLALVNVHAALQLGVSRFDASLAGIGGCPHAPGASGNASTEDLAFMLEAMGIDTGLDIPALLALRSKVVAWLEAEPTHGTLWRAGLPKTFPTAAVA
jgi:hydroxymethylglutaryl-CoA lyase